MLLLYALLLYELLLLDEALHAWLLQPPPIKSAPAFAQLSMKYHIHVPPDTVFEFRFRSSREDDVCAWRRLLTSRDAMTALEKPSPSKTEGASFMMEMLVIDDYYCTVLGIESVLPR